MSYIILATASFNQTAFLHTDELGNNVMIAINRIGGQLVKNGLSVLDDGKKKQLRSLDISGDLETDFPTRCGVGEVALRNFKAARAGIESTWQVNQTSGVFPPSSV